MEVLREGKMVKWDWGKGSGWNGLEERDDGRMGKSYGIYIVAKFQK